jgi:hypothetical protein
LRSLRRKRLELRRVRRRSLFEQNVRRVRRVWGQRLNLFWYVRDVNGSSADENGSSCAETGFLVGGGKSLMVECIDLKNRPSSFSFFPLPFSYLISSTSIFFIFTNTLGTVFYTKFAFQTMVRAIIERCTLINSFRDPCGNWWHA